MSTTRNTLDEGYRDAMAEQLAQLSEEFEEIKARVDSPNPLSPLIYRAIERNLQLLIEACIGISKQTLKGRGLHVPADARQTFEKLRSLGLDKTDTDWKRIVGMRNALVHDYLNLDRARILDVIRSDRYLALFRFAESLLGS